MKNKKIILIGLIIIAIIIIFRFINFDDKNENGNIANMGLATKYNGVVYYNKYEKGIFSYKNGNEEQLTSETAYSINAENDRIYYLTIADFDNVVIKYYDLKSRNVKSVSKIYTTSSKFYVKDGNIYYISAEKNGISKLNVDTKTEDIIISERVKDFQIKDSDIYYINEKSQICKSSISGSNSVVLNNDIKVQKIQVVEKWIYYYNETENALFRMSFDGEKNEVVSVLVNSEIYNVSGKYVYYIDKENSKIARMHIGKTNKCDDIVDINISKTKINIAGDEIYYLDKSQDESQTYQIFRVKSNGKQTENIEY